MGCCYSKTTIPSSSNRISQPQAAAAPVSSAAPPVAAEITHKIVKAGSETKIYNAAAEEEAVQNNSSRQEDSLVKKEIFVIKHRKSHDRDKRSSSPLLAAQNAPLHPSPEDESASSASASAAEGGICNNNNDNNKNNNINTVVRTSSCTKEEVDAILIQCGRLSRSNSSGKTPLSSRKYSGSKRSYDFDNENDKDINVVSSTAERPRHWQSSMSSSQGRRRTPSRERDQRSGSRERGSGSSGGGRRVSRSPGRRTENNSQGLSSNASANSTTRPKMASVPATVSALEMDKSNNIGVEAAATTNNAANNSIKRISVKRNVGVGDAAAVGVVGSRTAASPRSQSPARANSNAKGCNDNQQQQPTLNRSSSRKAEHSPYRRNPLSEIDPNSLAYPHSAANKNSNKVQGGIKESTNVINQKSNVEMNPNPKAKEQKMIEAENLKSSQPILTRSRSSRRSRDLDINPETLLNPIPSSYTTLLLEDIQNFHQTNNNLNASSFSLPACVSKACTILEAVADLNSTTSSKLSSTVFSEERKCQLPTNDNGFGRKMTETKDPFVESEVMGSDDLMEPSFHKYVTVRRGGSDMDEQESSGSNSFVGSSGNQLCGFSSSSREPNSADSTDRWTSSSATTRSREEDYSGPLGHHHRHGMAAAESGNSSRKGLSGRSGRRRDSDHQHQHAGGKIGAGVVAGKGVNSILFAATT